MVRKGGLGKGLEALIPTESSSMLGSATFAPINKISPNPRQPRQKILNESLQELASSIRLHGILQPLIVTYEPNSDRFILISGERRLRAAELAGLEMVPVIVHQATEQQRLELALIENLQRSDLSPLETAEAYRQLNNEFGLTHEEIAQQVGKSREAVSNTLRLLKLPALIQQTLAEGNITEGHARALLALPTTQSQLAALNSILKFNLTVRQTEELVKKLTGEKPPLIPQKTPSAEDSSLEERLRNHFGTKVTLVHGKKGGRLVIHYFSDEELDALINQLLKE